MVPMYCRILYDVFVLCLDMHVLIGIYGANVLYIEKSKMFNSLALGGILLQRNNHIISYHSSGSIIIHLEFLFKSCLRSIVFNDVMSLFYAHYVVVLCVDALLLIV